VTGRGKGDFSRFLIKSKSLIFVVIGRSIRVGVNSIETDESLKRFEKPIQEILEKT
jgi:hypothetical protein